MRESGAELKFSAIARERSEGTFAKSDGGENVREGRRGRERSRRATEDRKFARERSRRATGDRTFARECLRRATFRATVPHPAFRNPGNEEAGERTRGWIPHMAGLHRIQVVDRIKMMDNTNVQ